MEQMGQSATDPDSDGSPVTCRGQGQPFFDARDVVGRQIGARRFSTAARPSLRAIARQELPTNPPTLGKNLQISTLNVATGTASPHISAANPRAGGVNVQEDGEFPLSRTASAQTGAIIPLTGDASPQTGGDIVLSATAITRTDAAILSTGGASLHIPGQNPENGLSTPQKPGKDCLLQREGEAPPSANLQGARAVESRKRNQSAKHAKRRENKTRRKQAGFTLVVKWSTRVHPSISLASVRVFRGPPPFQGLKWAPQERCPTTRRRGSCRAVIKCPHRPLIFGEIGVARQPSPSQSAPDPPRLEPFSSPQKRFLKIICTIGEHFLLERVE